MKNPTPILIILGQIAITSRFCAAFVSHSQYQNTKTFSKPYKKVPQNDWYHRFPQGVRLHVSKENDLYEPDESSTFGRKTFWDDLYRNEHNSESQPTGFSWYSTWSSIQPFWDSIIFTTPQAETLSKIKGDGHDVSTEQSLPILLPGVGNDPTIGEMIDDGWTNVTAFDYAPEGVEACKTLLGKDRLRNSDSFFLQVDVADARALEYSSNSFVGVLDKGTLDAVYLSGGNKTDEKRKQLALAVKEITRIVKKGGVVLSLTGAGMATDDIRQAFMGELEEDNMSSSWEKIWDTGDGVVITDDGFASIDVDATMLAYRKL